MATLSPLLRSGISVSAKSTIVPNAPVINTFQFAGGYNLPPTNVDTSIEDSIARAKGKDYIKRYQFPSDLSKYNITLIENDIYVREGNFLSLTPEKTYKLPLPNPMTDVFSIAYKSNFSVLNAAAEIAAGTAGAIWGARVGAAVGSLLPGIGTVAGTIIGGATGAVVGYITAEGLVVPVLGIADSVLALGGSRLNQFKTVTLDSPEYRQFELNWKLAPRNYEESAQIQSLITSLKRGSSMRIGGTSTIGIPIPGLFAFPKIYLLHFQPNAKFLYKFKPAVLRSITVHYDGGSGTPSFYKPPPLITAAPGSPLAAQQIENNQRTIQNSPPESVIINTSWLEIEFWRKDNYKSDPADEEMQSSNPYDVVNDVRGIQVTNT